MKVPVFSSSELIKFLQDNGVEVVSHDYFDDYDRIILRKDNYSFPLQHQESYFYPIVCRICEDFEIDPPEQHRRNFEQHRAQIERSKKQKGPENSE